MPRHKHADAIHAWAEGEKIEVKDIDGRWITLDGTPWWDASEYRIKPKPVKKEGWVNVYSNATTGSSIYPTKEEAIAKACPEAVATIFIEWAVEEQE